MAQFETSAGIDKITGKLDKQSDLTMRQKYWHAPDGRIIGCGPMEVYSQQKRDYKRRPRTPAEQAQYDKWVTACQEAKQIVGDSSHPRRAEMEARFEAQLTGEPDPAIAPKRIGQFGNFIRSVLMHE